MSRHFGIALSVDFIENACKGMISELVSNSVLLCIELGVLKVILSGLDFIG